MTKYTMRDASGQLWYNIDDENLSQFMNDYPDAIIVSEETIEEPAEEEQPTEENVEVQEEFDDGVEQGQMEAESNDISYEAAELKENAEEAEEVKPDPESIVENEILEANRKEQERLKRKLMGFHAEPEVLKNHYKYMGYSGKQELLNQLTEADQTLIAQDQWGQLSQEAKLKIETEAMNNRLLSLGLRVNPATSMYSTLGDSYSALRHVTTFGTTELYTPYSDKPMEVYERDVNNFVKDQEAGKIPLSFLNSDLGTNLIGHEEEKVVPTLANMYGEYGFRFEETGAGDAMRVYAENGKDMVIDLDNWTESGDREESKKLAAFMKANAGEYKVRTFDAIAAFAERNKGKIALEKGDYDFFKLDRELSDEDKREWAALYDEDILNEKRKNLEDGVVKFQKEQKEIQDESAMLQAEWNTINTKVKTGEITREEFDQEAAKFQEKANSIKLKQGELSKLGQAKLKPMDIQLQYISGYQSIIQEDKGSWYGAMGDYLLDVVDNIENVALTAEMAMLNTKLMFDDTVSDEEREKIVNEQGRALQTDIKENLGSDNTNEYQRAFDDSIGGGILKTTTEVVGMIAGSLLTGPAAPYTFGVLMGAHMAGDTADEMMSEEFDDVSPYAKLGFASTIGIINGAIEYSVGKVLKFIPGGKVVTKGINKYVTNPIARGVFQKIGSKYAGKEVTTKLLQKTTQEVIDEGIKKGTLKLTKQGLVGVGKGVGVEIGTELTQTVTDVGLKSAFNAYYEEEKFRNLGEQLTKKNLIKTAIIAGTTGGMFGGYGAVRNAARINKSRSYMAELNDKQYAIGRFLSLNPMKARDYSNHLMNRVQNSSDPLTKKQAEKELRELKEIGGMYKQLSSMGITLEGERLAFPLLHRKKFLQKQIDNSTDKAIVKRQREEITKLDKALEDISTSYDFESAYQRGLDEAQEIQVASDKGFNIYKTDKEFEAKMKEFGEKDDGGFRTASGYRSAAGDIYINDAAARRLKDISVGQHELLHGITAKQLEGRGKASQDQLITDFKSYLTPAEAEVVNKRIKDNYNNDPTTEEYFNAFVDGVVQGDIKQNENVFTKIGDWITNNILKPLGFKQASFKNGAEVYRFIKGYAKQSKAIAEGRQKGFTGDIKSVVDQGVGTEAEGRMSKQTPTVEGVDAKQVETMINKVANRAWTRFGKNIPANIREEAGVDRKSYIDSAKSELAGIAEKFDSSKAEFDRYMANTGMQRLNSLAKRLGVKSAEQQTTSIDSEQAQQVEAAQDDFKDTRTEREIRQDERAGVKARTKVPKVYDIDKVVKAIRSKAKGKDLTSKNIKQLKGFALEEISMMIGRDEELGKSIFKKISKNADLNKAEMLAIQKFINVDSDFAMNSLLEGYTSEFKATGVVNKLLEKFYNKRSVRAKTGPGLNVQIKKPNIDLKEFKEAFGIVGKDQANWNQKVVASKGGVSDILKGFVRNLDQVISSQEIREQAIAEGKPIEALRTLRDGMPQGFFSRTAKNMDLVDQMALVEVLTSDKFLDDAEALRTSTPPNSEWLATALRGAVDKDFRKRFNLTLAKLRTIGDELQQEFDPKKSWKEYIKKAVDIQIDEAKIGMYSTLKQIAKARGFNIETGTGAYSDLKKLNKLRLEISNLLQDLKQEGVSDSDISKYILPALVGSYKMGSYKLNNNRIPPSAILQDSDIFIDEGTPRQGIYGSSTDANANADVNSKDRISGQIHKHKSWYIKPLSRAQQKEYGVKDFDDLPLNKRGEFIKKEIQPEGLRAKEVLDKVTNLMAQLVKDNKLSPQTASIFIDLQFARMDGLGKLASDVRFIPFNTRSELMSLFDLAKNDDFVLEHTIPGNRIKLAMYNAVLGGDKASMELFKKDLAEYHSAIIPKAFDNLVNRKDGKELYLRTAPAIRQAGDFALSETGRYADNSRFPMSLYDADTKDTYGEPPQIESDVQESRAQNNDLALSTGVETPAQQGGNFSKTNGDIISDLSTLDEALNKANSLDQPIKKIRVFDFDDTVGTSKNIVIAKKDGDTKKLNAEEFAKEGLSLIDQGWDMDFSDFNKVTDGGKGPLFDLMKKMKESPGDRDMFILTARAAEAAPAIHKFLKEMGIDIPLKNIIGLGNSTGEAKAQWLVGKAAEGYNDFYFADDAIQNVKAVKDAMEVLDVKSKVQQAKPGKFSLNKDFNDILFETTGEDASSVFSDVRAKIVGAGKGKRKFWIPYSAEDFMGLIYPLLGKGKKGDAHMKWFKDNLFDPFAKAADSISASRLQMMEDFRALKKKLNVPKRLKKDAVLGFTNEQAVRVFIWNMQGVEVPGISKSETEALVKHVTENSDLKNFGYEMAAILKGDPLAKPNADWLAGTLTTDLMTTLNTTKRARFLQQWQQNVDAIFTKENLNKLEALYGSKYREALENSLARMKSGKNRLTTGNRLSNRILDYINGSVGTIMFLNMRSAVLQTISSINFINWSDNNPLKAGAALANQGQYWKDFMTLINSDFLKDRRAGLRLNINESEIADAAKTGKNKAKAVMSYILQKGYAPTQFADSFAIASGGATFYRNRINTYIKQGMSQAQAEAKAMQDFREIAEESQQSSRPDKISQQQSSDLGRIILAFANTPLQYGRLTKRAYQDLIAGRGDAKSNISKIVYYTFVQNMIFNALQQAVFALGFGDDEEEKDDKKIDVANGMLDSVLRGLGIGGVTVSVAKNFLFDIYERSGRSRPEYVDSVYKLLQFSPPISSKISKIRQAAWQFDSKKRRQEMIDKGLSLDNPAYQAFAKVIAATTNLPLDRLYQKVENIEGALSEENDWWQRLAMMGGWPKWQLEPKPKKEEKKKTKKKKKKSSRGGYRKSSRKKVGYR